MIAALTRGMTLTQRAARSSAITVAGFGGAQAIRLASNLILARLLFPEAFGIMAMVSVFLMGLAMFSDVGTGPAIMQSRRGDDPDFLDTAWTIQILRGLMLYAAALVLTRPMALWYGETDLATYLPVAALTLVIAGFNPTRAETANRHMRAGRLTMIELATQGVGVVIAVALALWLQSVWALVLSGIASMLAHVWFLDRFLPGARNRLAWERPAARELVTFGKWVFLSTICGFAIGQADKLILGAWLATSDFGIYNIGFFLASFPLMLGGVVTRRVLIPIYRESPPAASPANFAHLRRMRVAATGALFGLAAILAFTGPWLIDVLYDPRYAAASGIVVLIAVTQLPALVVMTYDQAALAAGDSRNYFVLAAARAGLVIAGLLAGLALGGLPGALAGQGLAQVAAYPVVVWLARRQGAWDRTHDMCYGGLATAIAVSAIWLHWPRIAILSQMISG